MCSIRCDEAGLGLVLGGRARADPEPQGDGSDGVHALRDDPDARVELGQADASSPQSVSSTLGIAPGRSGGAGGRSRAAPPSPPPRVAPPRSRAGRGRRRHRRGRGAGRRRCRRRRRQRRRSSSTDLPAISGSSARRRPMRPRSRSTSTTRTSISSPLLRTSSTVSTRWPGDDVGDVQQAVGALGQLDEGAEGRRLDDLAGELVADLDLLGHRPDALGQRLAQLAVGGVDEHLAVVVDVDLRLELLRQAADRLAALADQQADLVAGRSAT